MQKYVYLQGINVIISISRYRFVKKYNFLLLQGFSHEIEFY